MNERQVNLLTYLINSQDYEPTGLIADHFGVSEKTIRRDVVMIKMMLSEIGASINLKRGKGIRLIGSPEAIKDLQDKFLDSKHLFQERKERNLLQSFFILFSPLKTIPLKAFGNAFYISRSQLLLDVKTLKEIFGPYQVEIDLAKEGIGVIGEKKNIDDLLVFLASQYRDYGYLETNIFYPREFTKGVLVVEALFKETELTFLQNLIGLIEDFGSRKFWKQDRVIITISLLILIKRKQIFFANQQEQETIHLICLSDDSLLSMVQSEIEKEYGFRLNKEDLNTINNAFQATGLVHDLTGSVGNLSLGNHQGLINNFSEDFIDAFSTITDINLRLNDLFCKRIKDHIEPMINRVLINLSIADRLLDTYAEEYQSTMNVCEVICWILSKKYNLPEIPRAEVLFLMLYIQTEIVEAESRLKVGLLSTDERSIVTFQAARLAKEFPHWKINQYQKLTKSEFYKDGLDFVIATRGNQLEGGIPQVEISQRMSELDLRLIKSTVFNIASDGQRQFTKLHDIFRDLMDLGCAIQFGLEAYSKSQNDHQSLTIKGVGECVFTYFDIGETQNSLYVQIGLTEIEDIRFIFDMNNSDFLLFASKIVYLVDRTEQSELFKYIQNIAAKLKENNV
ncbi:MAG: PRD domain-containing protein [Chloroflexi bacterium]|jgi:transcriptional antiterminator|nr:PRD domain-containing protein [Chloroflexota bacterium]